MFSATMFIFDVDGRGEGWTFFFVFFFAPGVFAPWKEEDSTGALSIGNRKAAQLPILTIKKKAAVCLAEWWLAEWWHV